MSQQGMAGRIGRRVVEMVGYAMRGEGEVDATILRVGEVNPIGLSRIEAAAGVVQVLRAH